jgi:hypothetical protein
MPTAKLSLHLAKISMLALLLAALTACQPIGAGDPLDQDAFVTESAPVVPVER